MKGRKDASLHLYKLMLVIVLLVSDAGGQKFLLGTCPVVTPVANFASSLLTGTWIEFARTPSINEHSFKCVSFTFTPNVGVTMFGIRLSGTKSFLSNTITAFGSATFPSGITTGIIRVVFPNALSSIGGTSATTYTIIATDGSVVGTTVTAATFFVLYSCRNVGLGRKVNVIFLTSTANPPQATIDLMNQAVTNLGVLSSWVKLTDQSSC